MDGAVDREEKDPQGLRQRGKKRQGDKNGEHGKTPQSKAYGCRKPPSTLIRSKGNLVSGGGVKVPKRQEREGNTIRARFLWDAVERSWNDRGVDKVSISED